MTPIEKTPASKFQAMLQSGQTVAEIARKHNCDGAKVRRFMRARGIEPPETWKRPSEEEVMSRTERMTEMFKAGDTQQKIAEEFGISRERVRQLLKKAGLTGKDGGQHVSAQARREERKLKKDQMTMAWLGCTEEQHRAVRELGSAMMAAGAPNGRVPMNAYNSQRFNARKRGVAWNMTFWEWWTIWQESGKWEQRGRGQGYVMCRKGDCGAYEVGNVFIDTAINNNSNQPRKKNDLPTGVYYDEKRDCYISQRMVGGVMYYVGSFASPGAAHRAYLEFDHTKHRKYQRSKQNE